MEAQSLDSYDDDHCNRLDFAIISQLRALVLVNETTVGTKKKSTDRNKVRTKFHLQGFPVCRTMYLFSFGISRKRFRRLQSAFLSNGVVETKHGNAQRLPKNALTTDTICDVVDFIRNYAQQNAIYLPGRQAGQFNMAVKVLPTSDTKADIYEKSFKPSCVGKKIDPVSLVTFRRLWRTFCPEIVISKPKTDLCSFCQKNFTSVKRSKNLEDEEKQAIANQMMDHLDNVSKEREYYKELIASTKKELKKYTERGGEIDPMEPNSYPGKGHHSFDMAQLVAIPHNPFQPGPMYFLTGFKICIFGIMNDTQSRQINYLIPESVAISKSSSYIVSMLHDYLQYYALGECDLYLHADNCCWQNKNNTLMAYLNYRIVQNLNRRIELHFMPPGHTKFSCDWAFGLFKQKFRMCEAYSVQDVADIVQASTPNSKINYGIPISNELGVDLSFPFSKWTEYFEALKWNKIPKITSYYHFEFSTPGSVLCRTKLDDEPCQVDIGSNIDENVRLEEYSSTGLPLDRQQYLFKNLREYIPPEYKDTLCPEPTPSSVEADTSVNVVEPKQKVPTSNSVEPEQKVNEGNEKRKRGRPRKLETKEKSGENKKKPKVTKRKSAEKKTKVAAMKNKSKLPAETKEKSGENNKKPKVMKRKSAEKKTKVAAEKKKSELSAKKKKSELYAEKKKSELSAKKKKSELSAKKKKSELCAKKKPP